MGDQKYQLSKIFSGVIISLEAYLIELEIVHRNGIPSFDIVGLPDAAIKESKDRVLQAIKQSGFEFSTQKILCNLAPAHIKKTGTFLDLSIALGILSSTFQIQNVDYSKIFIIGELGFQGQVRPIHGALSLVLLAKQNGFESFIFPYENQQEISIIDNIKLYPVANLQEAISSIKNEVEPIKIQHFEDIKPHFKEDFQDVKGQAMAKRAAEIAAAGFHNMLLVGSPGVGKSMLAKRLATVMPPLSLQESIEITQIYSSSPEKAGGYLKGLVTQRPFRSPHHSASDISIAGGGSIPKPGEISLAHHGVLFLDELPEFKRSVFEVLREPLEDHTITISRSEKVQQFPAHFLLIGAMNPCPCGYALSPTEACHCSANKVKQYYNKISGPIIDRIDLHIQMAESKFEDLNLIEETSDKIRQRVINARNIQFKRFHSYIFNSQMNSDQVKKYCQLDPETKTLLKEYMDHFSFSMRSYFKIMTIARTIADLENSENIETSHLLEAIQYRKINQVAG